MRRSQSSLSYKDCLKQVSKFPGNPGIQIFWGKIVRCLVQKHSISNLQLFHTTLTHPNSLPLSFSLVPHAVSLSHTYSHGSFSIYNSIPTQALFAFRTPSHFLHIRGSFLLSLSDSSAIDGSQVYLVESVGVGPLQKNSRESRETIFCDKLVLQFDDVLSRVVTSKSRMEKLVKVKSDKQF